MAMNVVVDDELSLAIHGKILISTSADNHAEVSSPCDSGSNVPMTLWKEDLKSTRKVNRTYKFGNKG